MKSEKWTTESEIKRNFPLLSDSSVGAGFTIYRSRDGEMYIDASENHAAAIGMTGKGKTQTISLSFERNILQKRESLIMVDPKGEGWKYGASYVSEEYQKYVIDLRSPRKSMTSWNPLKLIYNLHKSEDPDDQDKAAELLENMWHAVFTCTGLEDPFWPESAENLCIGLSYAIFDLAKNEDEINIDSVARILEIVEKRLSFGKTVIEELYDVLDDDSIAKRSLGNYVHAPSQTRGSILSVACSGIQVFSRSKGLMELLANDNLDILNIDPERPFAIWIIVSDASTTYHKLAGICIDQLMLHLLNSAERRGGKLPIRVNVICEELGSVGIPKLPSLLASGRSRNIRCLLVLQNETQLDSIFGQESADSIRSCIGITFAFSANHQETLEKWSEMCGEKNREYKGQFISERLITPAQIAALPVCTSLVLNSCRYKYIAQFDLFENMYDNSDWKAPIEREAIIREIHTYDLHSYLKEREEELLKKLREESDREQEEVYYGNTGYGDLDDLEMQRKKLVSKIDTKIREIEQQIEDIEKGNNGDDKKESELYTIRVKVAELPDEMAKIISNITGIPLAVSKAGMKALPYELIIHEKLKAWELIQKGIRIGTQFEIMESNDDMQ